MDSEPSRAICRRGEEAQIFGRDGRRRRRSGALPSSVSRADQTVLTEAWQTEGERVGSPSWRGDALDGTQSEHQEEVSAEPKKADARQRARRPTACGVGATDANGGAGGCEGGGAFKEEGRRVLYITRQARRVRLGSFSRTVGCRRRQPEGGIRLLDADKETDAPETFTLSDCRG